MTPESNFPSAADRDAARRAGQPRTPEIMASTFGFNTAGLSDAEKAAAIVALTALRSAETKLLKKRARIERDPWRRSQRAQRRIEEFFDAS